MFWSSTHGKGELFSANLTGSILKFSIWYSVYGHSMYYYVFKICWKWNVTEICAWMNIRNLYLLHEWTFNKVGNVTLKYSYFDHSCGLGCSLNYAYPFRRKGKGIESQIHIRFILYEAYFFLFVLVVYAFVIRNTSYLIQI